MSWVYSVAFKRRNSAKLLWIQTTTQDVVEASKQARNLVAQRYPAAGYVEYGHSKTRVTNDAI
jgi:hypothetical protein